jgi:hypothetical protein
LVGQDVDTQLYLRAQIAARLGMNNQSSRIGNLGNNILGKKICSLKEYEESSEGKCAYHREKTGERVIVSTGDWVVLGLWANRNAIF